ncbi:MAG: hypothetical protein GC191_18835 [Azospirillum sp.]|nr:hypothetical protein [Azospirillum sp.]
MRRWAALAVLGLAVWASPVEPIAVAQSASGDAWGDATMITSYGTVSPSLAGSTMFDGGVRKSFGYALGPDGRGFRATLSEFLWRKPLRGGDVAPDDAVDGPLSGDVTGHVHFLNPRISVF